MGMWWMGVRFLEEGREWRSPGILYVDDLVLCGELEEDLAFGISMRCVGEKVLKSMQIRAR